MSKKSYIDLVNDFWKTAIYLDGYKQHYLTCYFAILDSINKNNWMPTAITKEQMTTKTRLSNKMYYEALFWLSANKMIEYTAGKNAYEMAIFSLGYKIIEVHKVTSTNTATNTTIDTATNTTTNTHYKDLKTNRLKDIKTEIDNGILYKQFELTQYESEQILMQYGQLDLNASLKEFLFIYGDEKSLRKDVFMHFKNWLKKRKEEYKPQQKKSIL